MDLSAASIRRAIVPRRIAARLRFRGGLEDWLRDADLRRHGLPANAIAIVRRLQVPWTQVAGARGSLRHDILEATLRAALRPALEHGALRDAPAVWFVDHSEMLACLARDAIAGPLAARWWWPALLYGDVDRAAAMRYWIASARAVPRAVERLQSIDLGAPWFEKWSPPARHDLLTALARHYPLSAVVLRFVHAGPSTSDAMPRNVPVDSAWRDGPMHGHTEDGDSACDVSAVPSAPIRLRQLCLSLVRDPACAFDDRYIERALLREARPTNEKQAFYGTGASAGSRGAPVTTQTAPGGRATGANISRSLREDAHIVRGVHLPQTSASLPRLEAAAPGIQPDGREGDSVAVENRATAAYSRSPTDAKSDAAAPCMASNSGTVFETDHGGLFFVLNAALQLGLYGDFSQPQHRGLEMSPWRFLRETGVAFGGRRFVRDPLAAWLERFQSPDPEAASSEPIALARVLPELRARLVLALGLRDPRRLAGTLLRLTAQVRAGDDRIDVYFALQQLPIAVRLAGLDRDPGWVPAAGCDVRFHFE